jgi:hypothetical protein
VSGQVYRSLSRASRWRHLRRIVRASRRRYVGRWGWRVAVLPNAWAFPIAVVRDFPADCIMVHVLCVAVRVWNDGRR